MAVSYTVIILVLSFISSKDVPYLGFDFQDKIAHLLAYTLFAFFWFNYLKSIKCKTPMYYAIVFVIAFGIVVELLQERLTATRQFDYYDILANSIGALLIVPLLKLFKSYVKK